MREKIIDFCVMVVAPIILVIMLVLGVRFMATDLGKEMGENRQSYQNNPFQQYTEKYHRLCKLKEAGVMVPVGTIATEHKGTIYVLDEDYGLGVLYSSGSAIPMQKISIGVTDYYVATTRKGRP